MYVTHAHTYFPSQSKVTRMSTRNERREWQEFRERHGSTVREFRAKWQAMFERQPSAKEIADFKATKTRLTRALGSKARREDDAPDSLLITHPIPPHTTITRRFEWDMGHRLPFHAGKCRRLHGHRYVALISVSGPVKGDLLSEASDTGMVLDFGELDALIKGAIGEWDHRTMLWDRDEMWFAEESNYGIFRVPFIPTAENMVVEVVRLLSPVMPDGVRVTGVKIYETPKACAELTF